MRDEGVPSWPARSPLRRQQRGPTPAAEERRHPLKSAAAGRTATAGTSSGSSPTEPQLRPVAELVEALFGVRPSPSCITRWCNGKGRRGRVLVACKPFGRWLTTQEELLRFLECSSTPMPSSDPSSSDDELRAAGLL